MGHVNPFYMFCNSEKELISAEWKALSLSSTHFDLFVFALIAFDFKSYLFSEDIVAYII